MAFSKVILNGTTLMDVTDKTVDADKMRNGYTALKNDGTTVTGTIANGHVEVPSTTITANPSISVSSGGLITATASASAQVAPSVTAGYVTTGIKGVMTVTGSSTEQLTTQAAQTITPTTSDQTIASGKYLTGAQTIKGDANLVAGNIKKNVSIFGVTGSYEGGGGGSSSYSQLASVEQAASTTSTSSTNLVWVDAATNYDKWEFVRIRDKAGKRNGYFYGTDTFFPPNSNSAGTDATRQALRIIYRVENGEVLSRTGQSLLQTGGVGVFPSTRNSVGIQIQTKVDSNYAPIIDGTYTIEVYELDDPSGTSPLE